MTDLVHLLSKLTAPDGSILVPGVKEMVPRPDTEEKYVDSDILAVLSMFRSKGNLQSP
jgi:hypothetical protein